MPKWSRRPEEAYYEGMGLGRSGEDESTGLSLLISMALVVVLALMSFPLLESIVMDPGIRWAFLILVLLGCAMALLWAVLPKSRDHKVPRIVQKMIDDQPGEAEREVNMIANALEGSPFSQLHSYLELREMLVRRYMLLHHLPRVEAEAVLSDKGMARDELSDEDLVWLLHFDFKRAYEPLALSLREGQELVGDFNRRFPQLLKKLEALR